MWGVGRTQVHGIGSRCIRKWLRFGQTISPTLVNLTSDDLGIPLAVIQVEVARLKKTRIMYPLCLFEGMGEKE